MSPFGEYAAGLGRDWCVLRDVCAQIDPFLITDLIFEVLNFFLLQIDVFWCDWGQGKHTSSPDRYS